MPKNKKQSALSPQSSEEENATPSSSTSSSTIVCSNNTNTNNSSGPSLSKVIRQLVWNKYIGEKNGLGTCWCCRNKTISAFEFEAGHVVPRAKGGPDTVENLRPICSLCNKSMGTENMFEYQKRQNLGPTPSQLAWEWVCNAVSYVPIRIGWY